MRKCYERHGTDAGVVEIVLGCQVQRRVLNSDSQTQVSACQIPQRAGDGLRYRQGSSGWLAKTWWREQGYRCSPFLCNSKYSLSVRDDWKQSQSAPKKKSVVISLPPSLVLVTLEKKSDKLPTIINRLIKTILIQLPLSKTRWIRLNLTFNLENPRDEGRARLTEFAKTVKPHHHHHYLSFNLRPTVHLHQCPERSAINYQQDINAKAFTRQQRPLNDRCCSDSLLPQNYNIHRTSTRRTRVVNWAPVPEISRHESNGWIPTSHPYLSCDLSSTLLQKPFSNSPLPIIPSFYSVNYLCCIEHPIFYKEQTIPFLDYTVQTFHPSFLWAMDQKDAKHQTPSPLLFQTMSARRAVNVRPFPLRTHSEHTRTPSLYP